MRLNAVVVANLVMSTGFAIEFTAHVSRAFMLASGSRDARAAAALHELAPPVLNGALTTLLGLAPILVSEYSYFRLYFLLQCAPSPSPSPHAAGRTDLSRPRRLHSPRSSGHTDTPRAYVSRACGDLRLTVRRCSVSPEGGRRDAQKPVSPPFNSGALWFTLTFSGTVHDAGTW